MNKLLVALLLPFTLFVVAPTTAMAAPPPSSQAVQRVVAWNLAGNYVISFDCTTCVPHNFTITTYDPYTGKFAGSGVYAADPSFTWDISGTVSGNQVAMQILYTGRDAGYYVNLTGTIAPSGVMSGIASDRSGGNFGWAATSGLVGSYANHGHFVSAQANKQLAAQSDFGMPLR